MRASGSWLIIPMLASGGWLIIPMLASGGWLIIPMYAFGGCPICLVIQYLPDTTITLILYMLSDLPVFPDIPINNIPVPIQAPVVQPLDQQSSTRKRPERIPGLVGTNAAYLVPENIRKKFSEGWNSHVPLTYLTDKACMLKNRLSSNAAQDILSFDSATGQVITTSRVLHDNGELEMDFNEWHQAWRRLLELINTFIPREYNVWEIHYSRILNSENRAELWPLYLAYDAEIRKRTTQLPIDPSAFSIGIWNDLENRFSHKKVLSAVQNDIRQITERFSSNNSPNPPSYTPRNQFQPPSFRNQQVTLSDNPRMGRCIFCGDHSRSHPSNACIASCYSNGVPCHLTKQEPNGTRVNRSGKRYCFAWNGSLGCTQTSCRKGDHACTLCGATGHNAQACNTAP